MSEPGGIIELWAKGLGVDRQRALVLARRGRVS